MLLLLASNLFCSIENFATEVSEVSKTQGMRMPLCGKGKLNFHLEYHEDFRQSVHVDTSGSVESWPKHSIFAPFKVVVSMGYFLMF